MPDEPIVVVGAGFVGITGVSGIFANTTISPLEPEQPAIIPEVEAPPQPEAPPSQKSSSSKSFPSSKAPGA